MMSRELVSNKSVAPSALKEISIRVGELQRRVLEYAFRCSTVTVLQRGRVRPGGDDSAVAVQDT